ncbi:hypothetical protein C1645_779632, partial [Glomus cerebriforme]
MNARSQGSLVLPVLQLRFSYFSLHVSFLIHFFIFFLLFLFHISFFTNFISFFLDLLVLSILQLIK